MKMTIEEFKKLGMSAFKHDKYELAAVIFLGYILMQEKNNNNDNNVENNTEEFND